MNVLLLNLFKKTWFPYLFQIIGLIIYLGLIWFSIGVTAPPSVGSKFFAQNNIVTLIVWGVWLPFLIISTVILGRVWCTVCPLELVNKTAEKIATNLRIKKIKLPSIFEQGAISVVAYIALLFMVISTRFPRVPSNVAILLGLLLFVAVITGILFENRIFCKVICPAAMLLRVYGRRGIFSIRRQEAKVCSKCTTESCTAYCPNGLNPLTLTNSSNCTLCGQCVKSCKNTNITPQVNPMPSVPTGKLDDCGIWVTIFAFFLSGFVIEEMFHAWHEGEYYYAFIPQTLKKAIKIKSLSGLINGVWSMIVVPCMLWFSIGIVGKILNPKKNIVYIWKNIALPLVTILIGAQLIRAFTKFSHWITHFPSAVKGFKARLAENLI